MTNYQLMYRLSGGLRTKNMNITESLLQKITTIITAGFFLILPFIFFPWTTDFYDFPKQLALFAFLCVVSFLWILRVLITKKVTVSLHVHDAGLFLFILSLFLSFFFASTNKMAAFTTPIGLASFLILVKLSFLLQNSLDDAGRLLVKKALYLSGAILGIVTFYQFIGMGNYLPADYLKNPSWSPTGSLLVTVSYLIVILTMLVSHVITMSKHKARVESVLYSLLGLLIVMGIGLGSYQLATMAKPVLLPLRAGWFIALETFKGKPFFGVGQENFMSAFTQGRPVFLNANPALWNVRFTAASNVFFHVLTTTGILGLLSFLWIILRFFSHQKSHSQRNETIATLGVLLLFFMVFPPFLLLMTLFFILPVLQSEHHSTWNFPVPHKIGLALAIPFTVITLLCIYGAGRLYAADMTIRKAMNALSQNHGGEAYNLQIKAITLNPYNDSYHALYARTNLALANSLSQKKDLSDTDRSTISQLIQQSIREGKNAVILNRVNITNWENLSLIYRDMLRFVKGADQWALASFDQTVRLDPTNPVLRISYGGIFFATGQLDSAIEQYRLATQLKPDLANAWYNLAQGYREKKELDKSLSALQQVVKLVPSDSQDYKKAKEELDALQKVVNEAKPKTEAGKTPETLTAPQKGESVINPPLKTPVEGAPPQATEEAQLNASPAPLP